MRKLVARDHLEAYDLWAKHFSDPATMTNRDAVSTARKLARVANALPLRPDTVLLDVGPGDGTLFRLVADRVARCCGVDPSEAAVRRLTAAFAGVDAVEFRVGTANEIPYDDATFDVVVINSVIHILPTEDDIAASLRELVRVCRPGGTVFVGELPFRDETSAGIARHLAVKLRESGARNLGRSLFHTYVKPLLRGEPMLLYPATALHVPTDEFARMCAPLPVTLSVQRHHELRHESRTRNDYLISVSPSET